MGYLLPFDPLIAYKLSRFRQIEGIDCESGQDTEGGVAPYLIPLSDYG